jgi:hypothetical protein
MKAAIIFRLSVVVLVILVILAVLPYAQGLYPRQQLIPPPTPTQRTPTTITVSGRQWGQSTCYIGAVEGSSRFDIADLQDLGINSYRIFGGMPRWEPTNNDSVYGYPTITQIKANPESLNWAAWDKIMTSPPQGSDYWWDANLPRWQGNARTLFSMLQNAHIRTIITLRNQDDQLHPAWAPNPPRTSADWNEWWGHVFALVYWLNVRNHYDINDFEVQNEPNIFAQGWRGTEDQYLTFVRYTHDAIDYVYRTYLPGHSYSVYAPAISDVPSGRQWPQDALQQIPDAFNNTAIHIYDDNVSPYIEQVHGWMDATGHNYPLWLTEWGSYERRYNSVPFSVNILTNLLRESRPGKDYVYGSNIFSLYDFNTKFTGLINYNGERRAAYYAMRMGIRALQGCRPTYQSSSSSPQIQAITTMDSMHNIYLLVTNQDNTSWHDVTANLSTLSMNNTGTMWRFDAAHMDSVVEQPILRNGHVIFTIPAAGAVLLKFAQSA